MRQKVHLGITGLRRTGKTVFLTSLIYQLEQLGSKNLGCFSARGLTLHPATRMACKDPINAFPYTQHLQRLRYEQSWPSPTVSESGCVLRFYYQNPSANGKVDRVKGWAGLGKSRGAIDLHLHDYPGEYLLDVELAKKKFDHWSADALERMRVQCPEQAEEYIRAAKAVEDGAPEDAVRELRSRYGDYVVAARSKGLEFVQPAMSLLNWHGRRERNGNAPDPPDEKELRFVPLPAALASSSEPLLQQMKEEYEQYVKLQVKPFLKRIRRCHTQLVLVDVLRLLRNGVEAYNDTRDCVAEILRAYHDAWRPFRGIKRVLFAATKADHATRNNRANMTKLLDELIQKARGPMKTSIITPTSEWFTSLRATDDAETQMNDRPLEILKGKRQEDDEEGFYNPGIVPSQWPDDDDWKFGNERYDFPAWQPRQIPKRSGAALPHMNLDKVIWRILEGCF